jgi:hypothetical protein
MIFGVVIKTVYFFIVVPGIMGMYCYFFKNRKKKIIEKSILLFMFLGLIYFSLISSIEFFKDTSVVIQILKGFIIFFACFYFVHHYHSFYGHRFVTRLFMDLNKAGILQSAIVIATFISTDFKYFLYNFISVTEKSQRYLFGKVLDERYQGIAVSGFSFLSTTHALLLVIGVWGVYMNNRKYRLDEIILFFLGQLVIFVSICLIGRTGLVVILIFLCAFFIMRVFYFIKYLHLSKKTIKLYSVFLVLSFTILFSVDLSKYSDNINYAFETVITYAESGNLDRSVAGILQSHYIFPDNTFEILFGTGNFGRSANLPYIYSDVGYVLFIFGAGIFGILIGYSFYLMGFYYSYKYRRLNPYLSAFIVVYLIALIILNLKDYYYVSYSGYAQIYFIAICALGKSVEYRNSIRRYFLAPRVFA